VLGRLSILVFAKIARTPLSRRAMNHGADLSNESEEYGGLNHGGC
jgi:hypothetical protein